MPEYSINPSRDMPEYSINPSRERCNVPDEKKESLETPQGLLYPQNDPAFVEALNAMAKRCFLCAQHHGFWDEGRNDGEMIALMHSELSEALEALRHKNPPDDKLPEFSGVAVELADCVIRILDYTYARKVPLAQAIVAKVNFNEGREYKHGKEF